MIHTDNERSSLIELGDLVLLVARKLRTVPETDDETAPLSPLECLVLLHLHSHPGASPSSLAQGLGLTTSNTATALRGLANKRQIERRKNPADGRAAKLYLTDSAERAVDSVHEDWRRLLAAADIDQESLTAAVQTLMRINQALTKPVAQAS